MANKRPKPEEIVTKLRQAEVLTRQPTPEEARCGPQRLGDRKGRRNHRCGEGLGTGR